MSIYLCAKTVAAQSDTWILLDLSAGKQLVFGNSTVTKCYNQLSTTPFSLKLLFCEISKNCLN